MRAQDREHETLRTTYRYLRSGMVGLVLCLGAAVVLQSVRQGSTLSSISAYYYTPAQAIFVGVLVAIGVCMIVIRGATNEEDLLLNISGMLAPVVAVVPTGRGEDYRSALEACRGMDGSTVVDQALASVDCPTVLALREATELNVENNMVALLVVGLAGLVATLLFARWDGTPTSRIRVGLAVGGAVYALVALAYVAFTESFVDHAHYPAAVGMFACIVGVAVINALRHRGHRLSEVTGARDKTRAVAGAVFSRDPYGLVAVAMVAVVAVGVPLTLSGTFEDTVFWVEAALILLFAAFWVTQTKELWDPGQPDR